MVNPLPLQNYMDDRYRSADYEIQYKGATGFMLRSSHVLMEKGITPEQNRNVFEIGGGAMPHFRWMDVSKTEDLTISDDLDAHQKQLSDLRLKVPPSVKLHLHDFTRDPDFSELGGNFSRILASHVLEHIPDPESAIRLWASLLSPHGLMSIAIPCDPGWFWRCGQLYSHKANHPKLTFAQYDLLLSREHVNSTQRLLKILRYYFSEVKTIWFPSFVPVVDLNLVCVITCKKSDFRTD
jgi:phosphatidylethanolamine/phosphatidyl-N-methylethanolamine N-methyltransferase